MAYCSVLAITPTTEDRSPDCIGPANRPVAQHGGKYLARAFKHQQIEGEREIPRCGSLTTIKISRTAPELLATKTRLEYAQHCGFCRIRISHA